MSRIEGGWVPETEDEFELAQQVSSICHTAHTEEGVERDAIASMLTFLAAKVILEDPMEASEEPGVPDDGDTDCPECGETIDDFVSGMGLSPLEAQPCGCDLSDHPDAKLLYERVSGDD